VMGVAKTGAKPINGQITLALCQTHAGFTATQATAPTTVAMARQLAATAQSVRQGITLETSQGRNAGVAQTNTSRGVALT